MRRNILITSLFDSAASQYNLGTDRCRFQTVPQPWAGFQTFGAADRGHRWNFLYTISNTIQPLGSMLFAPIGCLPREATPSRTAVPCWPELLLRRLELQPTCQPNHEVPQRHLFVPRTQAPDIA